MKYKSRQEYYLHLYPEHRKYINECLICHTMGYRPNMQKYIGGQFCKTAEKIRQIFRP